MMPARLDYNVVAPDGLRAVRALDQYPADDIPRVFRGRPVAIMGATIGSGGTALSQTAWLPVLRFLGMRPWSEGAVLISDAARRFDSDGHWRMPQHGNASEHLLKDLRRSPPNTGRNLCSLL
jgi:NAD(P)H-dependent FMN reductase